MSEFAYPRPDLIYDQIVPIVVVALVDVSPLLTQSILPPRLLVLQRGEKVAYFKNTWSMPAGVVDNPIFRQEGPTDQAAIFQSRMELAGELSLFPQDLFGKGFVQRQYNRRDSDNDKIWRTALVVEGVIEPDKVYTNWEHSNYSWIPILDYSDLIKRVAESCPEQTPNLRSDLDSLKEFIDFLHRVWCGNNSSAILELREKFGVV